MHLPIDPSTQNLERVQEGMKVLDPRGEEIGKIDHVKMGDPEAVTTQGNEPSSAVSGVAAVPLAPLTAVGIGTLEPDVPEPRRSHLLRMGYVKVEGRGLFADDRYVAADEIAEVSGDTVRLGAARQSTAQPIPAAPS